ncbi:bifunctional (p)ppGpp synthetase/guanosine-3',5'-bis(diphosphate) 3'-pyrophosphohydrolase [Candidatus Peregrinibacteria bacterium]|nr:bifunctional (p)ppGpp synthetase/guanosine-3',5'-bis(diphosphate) 3'-pyrophosphohydrolase [Candidatus Peregrinibacteria bacterium]
MTDYEVYQKLQGQIALLKDVQSLDSINVVLTEEGKEAELNCYKLLGEVHRKYPVLADSFHDYISTPQPNGYRALHTTVFIAQNHLVKLRIQTRYMHDYNVRRKLSDWAVDPESNLRAALAALSKSPKDGSDYLEDLKSTVLEKPISIFTTLGEIISLPPDSTGVDFVYAVDPGYLRYLEGIWVNGERMEASRKLEDGDTVEPIYLVTEENGKHSMMWLNKVKSIEAREALKNAIQKDSVADVNTQARQILTQELGKERLSPTWLFRVGQLQKLVSEALGFSSFDHVLQDLGSGLLPVSRVVEAYKKVLAEPHGIFVRILSALHLLPRSRVLDNKKYLINIAIYAKDRRGLIYDITRCFAQRDINIAKFGVFAYPNGGALYHIRLEAKDFEEFSDLFDALLQVPSVTRVLRTR